MENYQFWILVALTAFGFYRMSLLLRSIDRRISSIEKRIGLIENKLDRIIQRK